MAVALVATAIFLVTQKKVAMMMQDLSNPCVYKVNKNI